VPAAITPLIPQEFEPRPMTEPGTGPLERDTNRRHTTN
jgi:hypothetical protein